MRYTTTWLMIAFFAATGCVPDKDTFVSNDVVRASVLNGFYRYDSGRFTSREVCFFEFFVKRRMDSIEWTITPKLPKTPIRHQFLHYVDFGFAIVEKANEPYYYGFSDIYMIEHAPRLDTIIAYENLALGKLLGGLFDQGTMTDSTSLLPAFLYHLYFQKRGAFASPLFENSNLSMMGLIFRLKSEENRYLTYVENTLSHHRTNLIIFELKHSGYLIFSIEKSGFGIQELFVPHNNRPRQLGSDMIPDEYDAACIHHSG